MLSCIRNCCRSRPVPAQPTADQRTPNHSQAHSAHPATPTAIQASTQSIFRGMSGEDINKVIRRENEYSKYSNGVHADIKKLIGYPKSLPIENTLFYQIAIELIIPVPELNSHPGLKFNDTMVKQFQYRIKIGDVNYHFWGDTHGINGLGEQLFGIFKEKEKSDKTGSINYFMEGLPDLRAVNSKIHPLEPDPRLNLIGRYMCAFIEQSLKLVPLDLALNGLFIDLCNYPTLREEVARDCIDRLPDKSQTEKENFALCYRLFADDYNTIDMDSKENVLLKFGSEFSKKAIDAEFDSEVLAGVLKYMATVWLKDPSVPVSFRTETMQAMKNYKNSHVRNSICNSPILLDCRDKNMAENLFSISNPGSESLIFLGHAHIPGVVKYLYKLHGKQIAKPLEGKEDMGLESDEKRAVAAKPVEMMKIRSMASSAMKSNVESKTLVALTKTAT